MFSLLYITFVFSLHYISLTTQMKDDSGLAILILSQDNSYHVKLAEKKQEEIIRQIEALNLVNTKVYSTHHNFHGVLGYWTIFPLLERLSEYDAYAWVFFCEDITYVDVRKLSEVLATYNSSDDVFAGYALKDKEPTIIHHFASSDATTSVLYPHFSLGFFLSMPLIRRLASRFPMANTNAFSIDPKYEFANFVWDEGAGTKLIHEPHLCISKNALDCATWIEDDLLFCDTPMYSGKIFIAVKTCQKFHKDRVQVVKSTWAKDVRYVSYFSDGKDISIPTIKLSVRNVPSGHCEKTLFIMKYYVERDLIADWIVIVDDDTLLSFERLKRVLACYNASEVVAVGERYGYSVTDSLGYDYITGGGGMAFSMPAIRQIIKTCQCPSVDSPDDMILGMCLKKLNIPVTHSPVFHQARPIDYAADFLKPLKHVSFHKHWMIDAYSVYKEWLQDPILVAFERHSEL